MKDSTHNNRTSPAPSAPPGPYPSSLSSTLSDIGCRIIALEEIVTDINGKLGVNLSGADAAAAVTMTNGILNAAHGFEVRLASLVSDLNVINSAI